MKLHRLHNRRHQRPESRKLRLERLESRQLLSIANGVDYQFEVVAKAQPDEWFTEIGGPIVPITDPQPTGAVAKVNQDYVWGMTQSGNFIWYSTSGNVLAQATGAIGTEGGTPSKNTIHVSEYAQSQYPGIDDAYRPYIGDWRPPKLYKYDMLNKVNTPLEIDDPLLNQTLGIRSAGANNTIVLFAGPDLTYIGMNVFAFNAQTGAYIGSQHILSYTDIRNWVNYNNQLYTGVSRTFSTTGQGSILRWTGSLSNPFNFTEVGRIDAEVAGLCVYNNRLYGVTWPLNYGSLLGILGYRSDAVAGLWMSPTLGTSGLSSSAVNSWRKVWSITDFDPDPVIAQSVGGGILASYNGYLVWGTMQVPLTGEVLLAEAYPDFDWSSVPVVRDPTYGLGSAARPVSVFRGTNFDSTSGPQIELLYGDGQLWTYVPGADPTVDPGSWQLEPNKMSGNNGIFGRAGFNDINNYYTWSSAVWHNPVTNKDELYIGTYDSSPVTFGDVYTGLRGSEGAVNTYDWVQYAWPTVMGADLWVFDDMTSGAEAASLNGLGNPLNHGVRTMQASATYGLFLGTANASNLLTAAYNPPTQPLKAGGAELVHMNVSAAAPIQFTSTPVAEMSPVGTLVGTFSVSTPGTYTYTLLDNAGGRFQIVGNQLQVASSSLLNYETIYQPTITVQATEAGGTVYQRPFTVYLTSVNEPPTNIRFLSSFQGIAENSPNDTYVTRLSTTDPDGALDTYTYELLDDAGGRFYVERSGLYNYLYVADGSLLNYEINPSHSIVVKVTDSGGLTFQKTLTVPVTNVNEAATDIALDTDSVAENSPNGTLVGNLLANDPDAGDTLNYTLLDNAGGRFGITGSQLVVANGSLLNYETNTSHTVTVQVADAAGLVYQKALTVTVTNVNESPTAVNLDATQVKELSPENTVIGNLSTIDPDVGDSHTYALLDSLGGRFKIAGSQVQVADGTLLHAGETYGVQVQSTDTGGLSALDMFTITVTGDSALTGIDVQNGMTQRSYIRYVDLMFASSSGLAQLISENRIQLKRYSLTGTGTPTTVSLSGKLTVAGTRIHFDFGSRGIGGSASSSTGDGYYEIGVDLDRNGTYETIKHFYRLFGDVTGDRKVDDADASAIRAAYGQTGSNLEADVNGSGSVNYTDWYYTRRARGRSLASSLPLDD